MDVGKVLGGRYRIERLLGRGGMGAVYEATQLDLARTVAIKLLDAAEDASHEAIAATAREARAAARLAHPHIVQVTDFSPGESGPPFLVMELLRGESLDERLARQHRIEPARAAFILVQVLSALGAAHASGIVHRDVKPANIFLTSTAATHDFVKLLDFGVAWSTSAVASSRGGAFPAGTPAYMAPEQIASGALDARADIWSVGVVLYEMLAGRAPFEAENVASLLVKVCQAKPTPLAAVAHDVDPELAQIVDRAMQREPNARFASADEMRLALARFTRSVEVPATAVGGARVRPRTEDVETARRPGEDAETMPGVAPPKTERAEPAASLLVGPESSPALDDSKQTKRSSPFDATLASSEPVSHPLATTLSPPRGGANRAVAPMLIAASLAAIIAGARAFVSSNARTTTPASSSPALTMCTLGPTLAPWPLAPVDGSDISLAVGTEEVLVAAEGRGFPRYASARIAGASALVEWARPSTFDGLELLDVRGCAIVDHHAVSAVAIWSRPRMPPFARGVLTTFGNLVTDAGPGSLPSRTKSLPHMARRLQCTSAGTAAAVVSEGRDFATVQGAFRLVLIDETRFENAALVGPDAREVTIAGGPDVLAVTIVDDTGMHLGWLDTKAITPGSTPLAVAPSFKAVVEARDVSEPAMALVNGDAVIAWMQNAPRRIEWARVTRGYARTAGIVSEGDVLSPAVVAHGEQVIIAYGKRERGTTSIYVGSGRTPAEASMMAVNVITTDRAVGRLRVARAPSGASEPWIAWIEASQGSRSVRAAPLKCP